jgi:hypothetical protein
LEAIALAIVVGLFAALVTAVGLSLVVWVVFKRRLVEPKIVFEEPPKKKTFLVPGDGIYTVHEKKKCKVIDEERLWLDEQNRKRE